MWTPTWSCASRRRARARRQRRCRLVLAALCLTGDARAALERPLFPQPPAGSALPIAGAAAVAAVDTSPCGWLGHDRPFGLADLAGQHSVVAAGLGPWLRLALGAAGRGPARHRERALWLAAGVRPAPWLALGVAARGRGWSAPGTRVWRWQPEAGGAVDLPLGWRLWGAVQGRDGPLPGRVWLRLQRRAADGAVAVARSAHGGTPARLSGQLLTRPHRRLDLWLEGQTRPGELGGGALVRRGHLRAWLSLREHEALGTSPAWGLGRACR